MTTNVIFIFRFPPNRLGTFRGCSGNVFRPTGARWGDPHRPELENRPLAFEKYPVIRLAAKLFEHRAKFRALIGKCAQAPRTFLRTACVAFLRAHLPISAQNLARCSNNLATNRIFEFRQIDRGPH